MASSTLTPYLQLPHLLSLTWLAYPILSLIFVAFRLQISLSSAQDDVANARSDLLASCQAAEKAATSAASMPRFLAIASNDQFADIVNGSLNDARSTLVLALTVMEAIINFIVDIYRSTFLCFLELVVRGGLELLISAVNELNSLVNSAASALRTSIQNDISSANSVIQTAIDAINKVNPFSDITAPTIPVPDLSSLQNVTLPDSFTSALVSLNNTLPTVSQLKNEVESIIDSPFELLKKDINDTFGGINFDASVLPVPQLNTVTFCDQLDLSIVDDVGHDLIQAAKIGLIILILLGLLLVGLNCLLEWYKWRCMKMHLEYTRQAWASDPTMVHVDVASAPSVMLSDHNLMMLNADSAHPLLTRIANNTSRILRLSPIQHTHLRWFLHYIFHPPALACLLIGLLGILTVEIQLVAMGPLIAKYQELSVNATSDFSNTIFTAINGSMYNQSATYANDINSRVDTIQTTINDGVFGWVNITTVSLNTTINNFYNDVQDVVTTVFGGTILEAPASDFIKCFIGSKVDAIENALTFLHDNLVINMPRVNDTVLVLSQDHINEVTQPIATAALGGGTGDGSNEGLLVKIVNAYAQSLRKERIMFIIFLGIWAFVVIMALCIILWHSYGKRWVEMRKCENFEREQRTGIDGVIVPFRMSGEKDLGPGPAKSHLDLPSFTPLPSPKGSAFRPFNFSSSASSSPAASRTDLSNYATADNEAERGGGIGWFRQKFVAPPTISKPKRLRKSIGKEIFVEDQPFGGNSKDLATSENVVKPMNGKNPAWLGLERMASMLDKKKSAAQSRPTLRISITPPVPGDHHSFERALSSRWSASPIKPTTEMGTTWKTFIKQGSTPIQAPTQPFRPVPKDAPADISPSEEEAALPGPFALPIHLGFDNSRYPRLATSPKAKDAYVPKPPFLNRRPNPAPSVPPENTPITRLLTSINARSSVDPFVTPFDDEHRVSVDYPSQKHKSLHTNPFLSPPVAG